MDANIKWNIDSDDLFRQMETVNQKLLQMTREVNTQQLLLTQESTNGMISIFDNYVQKIKSNFDIILDIAKTTWDAARNENSKSFDDIKTKLDDLTKFARESSNDQLEAVLDSINKKITAEESYVTKVKEATDIVSKEREKEVLSIEKVAAASKSITRTGTSAITSALGSETQTPLLDTGMSMIGKTIGAGIDFATMVEAGRGATSLIEVIAQGIGILANVSKKNDMMKQELFSLFGGAGEQVSDVYGSNFDVFNNEGTLGQLRGLEKQYTGIKGFDRQTMQQTMGQLGGSRLYGGTEPLFGMARDATMLGMGTGMQGSEVVEIFNQLRLKLNTPIDDLAGRFVQLNELSKEMGLSLRQVTADIIQLSRDNQKYGFSLEQVMSFYKDFEVELKKGTVSAGQLSEYMKGMAETGTEKAVGIAALISSQDPNKVLANFTGNRAVGQEIAGLMSGASPLEAAQLWRLINNPAADITNDPVLAPIASKYGLTSTDRKRMNPEAERYIMAISQTMAGESGDLGSQALVYEKITSLLGMNLPTNLYDRSMYNRGIQGLGDREGVISLGQGKELSASMMETLSKELPKITNFFERFNVILETSMQGIVNDFNKAMSPGGEGLGSFMEKLPKTMEKAMIPILKDLGFSEEEIERKKKEALDNLTILTTIGKDVASLASTITNHWFFKGFSADPYTGFTERNTDYSWDSGPELSMYDQMKTFFVKLAIGNRMGR